jgi:hypothetical protein
MPSGAISGGEDLPRNNECGDIWAKILEKVRKAVEKHQKFEPQGRLVELLEFEAYMGINQSGNELSIART